MAVTNQKGEAVRKYAYVIEVTSKYYLYGSNSSALISLKECLLKLKENKTIYTKGFDCQVYFVCQLFGMTYNDVIKAIKEL